MSSAKLAPLAAADKWLRYYERLWTERLDVLEALIRAEDAVRAQIEESSSDDGPGHRARHENIQRRPRAHLRCMLDPDLIGQWMLGPRLRDEEIVHLKADPRIGGSFSFLVRRRMEIDHIGTYREIERPRRIVFTWDIAGMSVEESVVEIDIVRHAAGCKLTLTHHMDAKWADYADRTHAGPRCSARRMHCSTRKARNRSCDHGRFWRNHRTADRPA